MDGSSHSLAAAKFVAKHAVFFGRSPELLLIHVSNLGEEVFYCDLDNPRPETPGERFGAEAYFDKVNKERIALEKMDAEKAFESVRPVFEGRGLLVREIPLTGEVAPAISRCARTEGLHLLVMGTRGLDNAASVTLGSVTSRVLAEGEIPVLVVKG